MNLIKKLNGDDDPQPANTLGTIIAKLRTALDGVKKKRKASRKALLKLKVIHADRHDGTLPEVSGDARKMRVDTERGLYRAFAEGGRDAVEVEAEERRLAARRLRELVPARRAAIDEAERKLGDARMECGRAHDAHNQLGAWISEQDHRLEELDREKRHYESLVERIAFDEYPDVWQPYSGALPPRQEPVEFSWRDFSRIRTPKSEEAAKQATRDWKANDDKAHREKCSALRLGCSVADIPLAYEDNPQEVA
jgi:hypothetical protein